MRKMKVKRPEKETATTAREEGHDSSLSGAPSATPEHVCVTKAEIRWQTAESYRKLEINGICAHAVDQKKPHYASTYSSPYNQCQEVARCGFNNRSVHRAQNAMSNHSPQPPMYTATST